jgi:hypothetical protein
LLPRGKGGCPKTAFFKSQSEDDVLKFNATGRDDFSGDHRFGDKARDDRLIQVLAENFAAGHCTVLMQYNII